MDSMNIPPQGPPQTTDEIAAAIFSECLYTMVNTAAMLLGKVSAPATGEPVKDLPRVKLVIEQLELVEKNAAKLSIDEQQLLKQSLQQLRMAYVSAAGQRPEDAVDDDSTEEPSEETTPPSETAEESVQADSEPSDESAPPAATAEPAPDANDEDDEEETGRKRFVKKYD